MPAVRQYVSVPSNSKPVRGLPSTMHGSWRVQLLRNRAELSSHFDDPCWVLGNRSREVCGNIVRESIKVLRSRGCFHPKGTMITDNVCTPIRIGIISADLPAFVRPRLTDWGRRVCLKETVSGASLDRRRGFCLVTGAVDTPENSHTTRLFPAKTNTWVPGTFGPIVRDVF